MYRSYRDLIEIQILIQEIRREVWGSAFLISSQVMLILSATGSS